MSKGRLEAFSDGVIAILITIMVLELRPPAGSDFASLSDIVPNALAYLLSFVVLAIYWNNHHHLFAAVERIDGLVLWANMHLLFWLSLFPFATAWVGEHPDGHVPVAAYGVALLGAAVAYFILTRALLRLHDQASNLAVALGRDWKGKLSAGAYAAGIALSLVTTWLALIIYTAVAIVWFVPDTRVHRVLTTSNDETG